MRKFTIVTTTINIPRVIESYISNIEKYEHSNVDFIVIGDMKSKPGSKEYVEKIRGIPARFLDVNDQKEYMQRFPELDMAIPYNTVQRRNIGYLLAYEGGADTIITIDDDNFAVPESDYIGGQSIIGKNTEIPCVQSSSKWFNPCDMMEIKPSRRVYHRGFPYSKRWVDEKYSIGKISGKVVVSAGLWLGNPDIDAVTRLGDPIETTCIKKEFSEIPHLALGRDTISPFNTQNTAFSREIFPCTFLPIMGEYVNGMPIDRYDDIFSGYFAGKIIRHLGDLICFGQPLVKQDRNPHNYIKDLNGELPGMILTDKLIKTLDAIELTQKTYLGCFNELIEKLRNSICNDPIYNYNEKAFFLKLTDGMKAWQNAVEIIM